MSNRTIIVVGDRIVTNAPTTHVLGRDYFEIPAGLTGIVDVADDGYGCLCLIVDDASLVPQRTRNFNVAEGINHNTIVVHCDPDHDDPWHAFTLT
jgi:hypothetical protein